MSLLVLAARVALVFDPISHSTVDSDRFPFRHLPHTLIFIS